MSLCPFSFCHSLPESKWHIIPHCRNFLYTHRSTTPRLLRATPSHRSTADEKRYRTRRKKGSRCSALHTLFQRSIHNTIHCRAQQKSKEGSAFYDPWKHSSLLCHSRPTDLVGTFLKASLPNKSATPVLLQLVFFPGNITANTQASNQITNVRDTSLLPFSPGNWSSNC